MEYKVNEENLSEKVFFESRGYSCFFFIYNEVLKDRQYKNFRIDSFDDRQGKGGIVIEFKNDFLEIGKMIFANYKGDDIYSYIEKYQAFFDKNHEKVDTLKLRGDFAELLFLKEIGGRKLDDSQIYDIRYEDDYIEVKSFSNQNRRVTISNEQLGRKSVKAIVEVTLDPEGIDILSLSKAISFNDEFKEYITDKYSESIYLDYKFAIKKPMRWISPEKVLLKEPIVSGKFKVNVLERDISEF